MHFGKAIRIALIKRDKTQTWLAEQMGVSRQSVSNMMKNKSGTTETLCKVSTLLDMELTELVSLGEE